MPVPYTTISQKAPAASGHGDKIIHYARGVERGQINQQKLIRDIEKMSALSGGDFQSSVYELKDRLIYYLSDGYSVHIDALGTFRITLSSKGVVSPELVLPDTIRKARLQYIPCEEIKQMLNTLEYKHI